MLLKELHVLFRGFEPATTVLRQYKIGIYCCCCSIENMEYGEVILEPLLTNSVPYFGEQIFKSIIKVDFQTEEHSETPTFMLKIFCIFFQANTTFIENGIYWNLDISLLNNFMPYTIFRQFTNLSWKLIYFISKHYVVPSLWPAWALENDEACRLAGGEKRWYGPPTPTFGWLGAPIATWWEVDLKPCGWDLLLLESARIPAGLNSLGLKFSLRGDGLCAPPETKSIQFFEKKYPKLFIGMKIRPFGIQYNLGNCMKIQTNLTIIFIFLKAISILNFWKNLHLWEFPQINWSIQTDFSSPVVPKLWSTLDWVVTSPGSLGRLYTFV